MFKLVTNRKFNVTDSSETKKRSIIATNFSILFISFLLSFSAEAGIVGTLSPDILSPHIAK